jgi:HEAT repeats
MTSVSGTPPQRPGKRELTPSAQMAAAFFRTLARTLKVARLYQSDNPVVDQGRKGLLAQLNEALLHHGPWRFRITPYEIWLNDEAVIRPMETGQSLDTPKMPEEKLPFLLHRDGVRTLALAHEVPATEFDAFFEALQSVGVGAHTHDDLVTLLWQANTQKIAIETVPFSQVIHLDTGGSDGAGGGGGSHPTAGYVWSPTGSEIRGDLGQPAGVTGLHRDTFEDWPLPDHADDVVESFAGLSHGLQFVRSRLRAELSAEAAVHWQQEARLLLGRVLEVDDDVRTRAALAHSVMTWLARSIQDAHWDDAREACELLRRFDPDGSLTDAPLAEALNQLDAEDITARLDESQNDDAGRFFGLTVGIGRAAIDLACSIMALALKSRTRAAACTMLCYLCSDSPELLARYLGDSRWFVVRNVVFVLGQIGGPNVVSLLERAARHPEPRVRQAVVAALGNCPGDERVPLLITQLDSRDPQVLATSLQMLGRARSPVVARAILTQIEAPNFAKRAPDSQRALFNALGDCADDEMVPSLETLLHKGGWFAQPSLERTAAARTLARIGSEAALAALETGLRAHREAIRAACLEALNMKAA